MSILQEVGRFLLGEQGRPAGAAGDGAPTTGERVATAEQLLERMAQLELALEDQEYRRLTWQAETEFSREGLRDICELARVMWLKNPLISRGVGVATNYVFGQGVNIHARAKAVDQVVQAFLDDPRNRAELTSQQAMIMKDEELTIEANLFFVFFVQPATGRVRVRTIPFDEVEEVICNPEDAKEPWFYRRTWSSQRVDLTTGTPVIETLTAYYPDWRYRPKVKAKSIGGRPVRWESPVYHVKVNCLGTMRFGVSEVYAAIDWARAYKEFLEDWATIVRAYSRFAWQLTVKGGKAGVQAAKSKLATTVGTGGMGAAETNPAPVTGSMFIGQTDTKLEPLRTAGATTRAEDGRRLLLMVAAALGLPESFFGDVSVGSLATAKSLDRPTELRFITRQTLWGDIFKEILSFVVEWAVRAPKGPLQGMATFDDGAVIVTLATDPQTGEPLDASIDVDFPPILEHDTAGRVSSIISAATLNGQALAGTMDLRTAARMLLTALGEDDVDALLDELFPTSPPAPSPAAGPAAAGGEGENVSPVAGEGEEAPTVEAEMREAVRELRGAIVRFVEEYAG